MEDLRGIFKPLEIFPPENDKVDCHPSSPSLIYCYVGSFPLQWQNSLWKNKSRPGIQIGIISLLFQSDFSDISSLKTLGSLFDSEFDFVSFFQRLETLTHDGFIMDENILAFAPFDKSKALCSVEPFDCSLFHETIPLNKFFLHNADPYTPAASNCVFKRKNRSSRFTPESRFLNAALNLTSKVKDDTQHFQ